MGSLRNSFSGKDTVLLCLSWPQVTEISLELAFFTQTSERYGECSKKAEEVEDKLGRKKGLLWMWGPLSFSILFSWHHSPLLPPISILLGAGNMGGSNCRVDLSVLLFKTHSLLILSLKTLEEEWLFPLGLDT